GMPEVVWAHEPREVRGTYCRVGLERWSAICRHRAPAGGSSETGGASGPHWVPAPLLRAFTNNRPTPSGLGGTHSDALRCMQEGRADVQGSGVPEAAWWAVGDTPPRTGCLVEPLIDGRAAMYAMCRAFLSTKHYILLAGWDIAADLPLVRGGDLRLGSDDSPQQRSLVAYLREAGM